MTAARLEKHGISGKRANRYNSIYHLVSNGSIWWKSSHVMSSLAMYNNCHGLNSLPSTLPQGILLRRGPTAVRGHGWYRSVDATPQVQQRIEQKLNESKQEREQGRNEGTNLIAMASSDGLQPTSDGLRPNRDGLQPRSDGLQPNRDGLQPTSDGLQPNSDGLQPNNSDCLQPPT